MAPPMALIMVHRSWTWGSLAALRITVVPLAKLGKELGIDYTVIKPISDAPDNRLEAPFDEYLEKVATFKEAETYGTEDYSVIIKWRKMGNRGNKRYVKCHGTRFIIAIEGDGSVHPCGHWFDIERDRFLLGNVNDTPLSEIFNSEQYWNAQNEIHNVDHSLRYWRILIGPWLGYFIHILFDRWIMLKRAITEYEIEGSKNKRHRITWNAVFGIRTKSILRQRRYY